MVALLGTILSMQQLDLIKHRHTIALMMVGDHAGLRATNKLVQVIQPIRTLPISMPYNRDPADLNENTLQKIIREQTGLKPLAATPTWREVT